jgi:hypothetical protein
MWLPPVKTSWALTGMIVGGYLGDLVYRRHGVPGKKYLVLITGLLQGIFSIAIGVYIEHHHHARVTPPRKYTTVVQNIA